MKKKFFLIFCLSVFITQAQEVNYKIVNDDPLDLKKLDISANFTMGGLIPLAGNTEESSDESDVTFGYNLRASYFPIQKKFGAEIISQSTIGLINSKSFSRFNLVGTYALLSKKKKKNLPFVLTESNTFRGGAIRTETQSIRTDRTIQTNVELRGGYVKTKGVTGRVEIEGRSMVFDYKSNGLSVGIQLRNFYNQEIKIGSGYYENSRVWILYADAFIMSSPEYTLKSTVTGIQPTPQEIEDGIKESDIETLIGGMVGVRYIYNHHRFFSYNFSSEASLIAPYKIVAIDMTFGVTFNLL